MKSDFSSNELALARRGRFASGLTGGVVAAALGLLFLLTPLGARLAELSYELLFFFRRDIKPDNVAILYMDWDSHVRLGQEQFRRWDRAVHARLLNRLKEMKAQVHEPVKDVGGGIKAAAVVDPFGNLFGIIENPGFNLQEVR